MGASSSRCGDLVGGFCGTGVESGGLDSLKLLSSSSIWFIFVYATMIMILSMDTTGFFYISIFSSRYKHLKKCSC